MSYGPFDLTGEPFLIVYLVLLATAIFVGIIIPRRMRREGRRQIVTDPNQIAYLAGGKPRFVDSVVARMLSSGMLMMVAKTKFMADTRAAAPSPAESAVLGLSQPFVWGAAQSALNQHAMSVAQTICNNGLLMSSEDVSRMRWAQTLPYFLLISFGSIKLLVGEARERPVGFLTALLILTAVFAVIRWCVVDRRTEAALHALADEALRNQRLKIAPTAPEVGLAVALFGTTVLAGSAWADYHKMRASDGGGSSSSSDGGGDGGGSGGGCGGCGS
jgi:uncharacterized protein (TIGR04222 family)